MDDLVEINLCHIWLKICRDLIEVYVKLVSGVVVWIVHHQNMRWSDMKIERIARNEIAHVLKDFDTMVKP